MGGNELQKSVLRVSCLAKKTQIHVIITPTPPPTTAQRKGSVNTLQEQRGGGEPAPASAPLHFITWLQGSGPP